MQSEDNLVGSRVAARKRMLHTPQMKAQEAASQTSAIHKLKQSVMGIECNRIHL